MFMRSRHSVATGTKHRQLAFSCVLPGKGTYDLDAWPRNNIQPVALIFILSFLLFYHYSSSYCIEVESGSMYFWLAVFSQISHTCVVLFIKLSFCFHAR